MSVHLKAPLSTGVTLLFPTAYLTFFELDFRTQKLHLKSSDCYVKGTQLLIASFTKHGKLRDKPKLISLTKYQLQGITASIGVM